MSYIYELQNSVNVISIGIILEILLVTSCISTIVFILTKNQYVSYLSSAPVFYFLSLYQLHTTHLFFLIVAMSVQALIIVTIQYQSKKKLIPNKYEAKNEIQ